MEGVDSSQWDQLTPEAQSAIQATIGNHFPGVFAAGDNSASQLSAGDVARDIAVGLCKAACSAAQAEAMLECAALAEFPPAVVVCEAAVIYAGSKCRDACDNM